MDPFAVAFRVATCPDGRPSERTYALMTAATCEIARCGNSYGVLFPVAAALHELLPGSVMRSGYWIEEAEPARHIWHAWLEDDAGRRMDPARGVVVSVAFPAPAPAGRLSETPEGTDAAETPEQRRGVATARAAFKTYAESPARYWLRAPRAMREMRRRLRDAAEAPGCPE